MLTVRDQQRPDGSREVVVADRGVYCWRIHFPDATTASGEASDLMTAQNMIRTTRMKWIAARWEDGHRTASGYYVPITIKGGK